MKYSIIIATHNGLEHTSRCLTSIFNCSKDFELIVVDNGSTDGTKGYLQELKARNENVKVISNPENTTFSIANNQGLKIAEGEYIVFLNNDTVVCNEWLERLNAHLHKIPLKNLGIVGPVTNNSNGKQCVGTQDPEVWHQENKGRWAHAGRLYGWCMMMRKSLLDEIGGFDERFINSHEDNDLCLRAQLAGYKLAIAYDTYIHHTGQGTLRKVFDNQGYLDNGYKNRELYYDKWYSDKLKKLVAVYRTNGGKWLEESLRQTSKFADSILIHFCRAPQDFEMDVTFTGNFEGKGKYYPKRDEYIKLLKQKFPKVIWTEFYDGIFQEDYERGRLLELALEMHAKGEADWCISVDDDEIYEDKFIEKVQKMMSPRNPEIFGYWCNWRTIWDRRGKDEYYRTDSTFGQFSNYRFFKLMKNQEINSHGHPEGHHCGSAPLMAEENLAWSNIRVKHMGYDTHEQRQRKYEFYEANDHFKDARDIGNKDYSHLIDVNVSLEKYRQDNGISLIMMVKNEEKHILTCLESVAPVIDEFVIVDTGSTDKTVEIVEKFSKYSAAPVKIFHSPWVDNYSIPRNYGKFHATKQWILMLDADERFSYEDLRKIHQMSETEADAVIFHVINYLKAPLFGQKPVYASTESVRMYRNKPELFYSGVIHETIDDAICAMTNKQGLKVARSPVVLHHYGYLKEKRKVNDKLNYYEMLNNKQIEVTEGKDPRPYFNLALHYLNDDKKQEALRCFQKALEINPNFWHANQQMAALNIQSAKEFLTRTIDSIPEQHPFKKQAVTLLEYLNSNSFGYTKVGV
ncbi:MAG: glycosyltransferase [Candidatus Omnitrophica bacterium]|nr:glycosyltransferase [Candidatus Omnitrophota bacterium]